MKIQETRHCNDALESLILVRTDLNVKIASTISKFHSIKTRTTKLEIVILVLRSKLDEFKDLVIETLEEEHYLKGNFNSLLNEARLNAEVVDLRELNCKLLNQLGSSDSSANRSFTHEVKLTGTNDMQTQTEVYSVSCDCDTNLKRELEESRRNFNNLRTQGYDFRMKKDLDTVLI